jgi:hypothetical protein
VTTTVIAVILNLVLAWPVVIHLYVSHRDKARPFRSKFDALLLGISAISIATADLLFYLTRVPLILVAFLILGFVGLAWFYSRIKPRSS